MQWCRLSLIHGEAGADGVLTIIVALNQRSLAVIADPGAARGIEEHVVHRPTARTGAPTAEALDELILRHVDAYDVIDRSLARRQPLFQDPSLRNVARKAIEDEAFGSVPSAYAFLE
jgi:hypothetical protein